jgi:hypothetical protein
MINRAHTLPSFIGWFALFIIYIFVLLVLYQRSYISFSFVSLTIFFSIASIIVLIGILVISQWGKFKMILPIFMGGSEGIGQVVDVYFFRGHGYITYEYEYQQEKYRFTDKITQNNKTKELTVGQKVTLYVNQEKPTQAFIRDLYLNTF